MSLLLLLLCSFVFSFSFRCSLFLYVTSLSSIHAKQILVACFPNKKLFRTFFFLRKKTFQNIGKPLVARLRSVKEVLSAYS